MSRLIEGCTGKGGHNDPPKTPKLNISPPAQRPAACASEEVTALKAKLAAKDAEIKRLHALTICGCDGACEYEGRIKELEDALRPFANFACEPPCGCYNCVAREVLEDK